MSTVETAIENLADEVSRLAPMWRNAISKADVSRAPAPIRPLRQACNQLIAAVFDHGLRLDEAYEAVAAAARGMESVERQVFVRAWFSAEVSPPPEVQRYVDLVSAVVAAADHEGKESRS